MASTTVSNESTGQLLIDGSAELQGADADEQATCHVNVDGSNVSLFYETTFDDIGTSNEATVSVVTTASSFAPGAHTVTLNCVSLNGTVVKDDAAVNAIGIPVVATEFRALGRPRSRGAARPGQRRERWSSNRWDRDQSSGLARGTVVAVVLGAAGLYADNQAGSPQSAAPVAPVVQVPAGASETEDVQRAGPRGRRELDRQAGRGRNRLARTGAEA